MKSDAGMHIKKTHKQGSENIKVRVNIQTLIHPCIIVKWRCRDVTHRFHNTAISYGRWTEVAPKRGGWAYFWELLYFSRKYAHLTQSSPCYLRMQWFCYASFVMRLLMQQQQMVSPSPCTVLLATIGWSTFERRAPFATTSFKKGGWAYFRGWVYFREITVCHKFLLHRQKHQHVRVV